MSRSRVAHVQDLVHAWENCQVRAPKAKYPGSGPTLLDVACYNPTDVVRSHHNEEAAVCNESRQYLVGRWSSSSAGWQQQRLARTCNHQSCIGFIDDRYEWNVHMNEWNVISARMPTCGTKTNAVVDWERSHSEEISGYCCPSCIRNEMSKKQQRNKKPGIDYSGW